MSQALIVVSDATPLNVLVRTDLIEVLPKLFGRVFVPPAVATELSHANTPQPVRDWLVAMPPWLEVRKPMLIDRSVARDPGEQEAINLALELKADFILLDERSARQSARRLNLTVVGTVGILEIAAERRLLKLGEALEKLLQTDFYLSDTLVRGALDRDAKRDRRES